MYINFTTRTDAETAVNNSGYLDWKWGGNTSSEGLVDYLWANFNSWETGDSAPVRAYLQSCGEDPSDYGIMGYRASRWPDREGALESQR